MKKHSKKIVFGSVILMFAFIAALIGCSQNNKDDSLLLGIAAVILENSKPKGTVEAVTFNPPAGTYIANQSVKLASTTSAVTICFTTNNTSPACDKLALCTAGTAYTTAVSVTTAPNTVSNTTLKAIACKEGWTSSAESTALYTIDTR